MLPGSNALSQQELHIGNRRQAHAGLWRREMKRLTDLVSEGFIWGVGITRPRPGQERMAALYITATLIASVIGAVGAFLFLLGRLQ